MKTRALISAVAFLATAMAAQAQEPTGFRPATETVVITPSQAEAIARDMRFEVSVPSSAAWLREEVDPIARERRRIRKIQSQLAQQTIAGQAAASKNEISKQVGQWNMSVGNTSAGNWSPYPDRELDARVIHFPMRGGRTAGDRKAKKN